MNHTETGSKAVLLLEELVRTYGVPVEFKPQLLSDRMGGAPTTIGRVQARIVRNLRARAYNVRYLNRRFCFEEPINLPQAARDEGSTAACAIASRPVLAREIEIANTT